MPEGDVFFLVSISHEFNEDGHCHWWKSVSENTWLEQFVKALNKLVKGFWSTKRFCFYWLNEFLSVMSWTLNISWMEWVAPLKSLKDLPRILLVSKHFLPSNSLHTDFITTQQPVGTVIKEHKNFTIINTLENFKLCYFTKTIDYVFLSSRRLIYN